MHEPGGAGALERASIYLISLERRMAVADNDEFHLVREETMGIDESGKVFSRLNRTHRQDIGSTNS